MEIGTWCVPVRLSMPTPEWSLWVDAVPRPGWQNMAIDHALLDGAEQGVAVLRLYRWAPPCLSFGAHEPAHRRYDRALIEARGLDCVRRPTGGRAVWHHNELTYALAAPLSRFGGLREAYLRIHIMLAAALARIGVPTTLAGPGQPTPGVAAGPCFRAAVGGEVMVEGKKLVGSAQLRHDTAFLQHGALLLSDDQSLLSELAGVTDTHSGATTVAHLLDRPAPIEEIVIAIGEAAREAWPGVWHAFAPGATLDAADALAAHYRDPAWTWCR